MVALELNFLVMGALVQGLFIKIERLMVETSPVFISASTLERSLLFCMAGVSFRSTSLSLPEVLGAAIPPNSSVVSACAICMATFASAGKNSLANATAGIIHGML